jgi:serine/threonine protein kinase
MDKPPPTAKEVFEQALEITSPTDRQAYVDWACAGVPDLKEKVEGLLRAHEAAGSSFLAQPAWEQAATGPYQPAGSGSGSTIDPSTIDHQPQPDPSPGEAPGTCFGPYKLIARIGQGGMGAVYLAEQEHPVRRKVALKIIKPGMDSAEVLARFDAERQALALMDHLSIARVLDAGTTTTNRPYFVMELVQGVPLTNFCDDNQLTPRQRLELFVPVCQAIQHAHQKGIIHRDIKPSNVLVTMYEGKPVPKVIDFGLAKAIGQPLTDRSPSTQFGAVVGTLEYMSPEQASLGTLDVDTQSDVYALGVLLYELLTGTTPLDRATLRRGEGMETLRRIREEEPPRPSKRLADLGPRLDAIADHRKTEPAKLARLLRGELDWIALKALEKDRKRRYETANGLGRDVERYLADEPVEACPPSLRYRVGKFARKHRLLLATVAGFLALLLLGVVGLIVSIVLVNAARERTQVALDETRETLDLTDDVFSELLPRQTQYGAREKELLRRLLERHHQSVAAGGETEQARETRAHGFLGVGQIQEMLGEHGEAAEGYRHAIALYAQLVADFPRKAANRHELARAYNFQGLLLLAQRNPGKAADAFREVITLVKGLVNELPDNAEYRYRLAVGHSNLGLALSQEEAKRNEALEAYHQAVNMLATLTAEHPKNQPEYRSALANTLNNRANLWSQQKRTEEAKKDYGDALKLLEEQVALFSDHRYRQELARTRYNWGLFLRGLGDRAKAKAAFVEALKLQRQLAHRFPSVPDYYIDLADIINALGVLLREEANECDAKKNRVQADALLHEAQEQYTLANTAFLERQEEFSGIPAYEIYLGINYLNLGNMVRDLDEKPEVALQRYGQAIMKLKPFAEQDLTARTNLRFVYWERARTLGQLDRHEDAAKDWEEALAGADGQERTDILLFQAITKAELDRKAPRDKGPSSAAAKSMVDTARCYALACGAAAEDNVRIRDQYIRRASELLRMAKDAGYFRDGQHLDQLKKDPAFGKEADLEKVIRGFGVHATPRPD